jgi:secreted trypsin-like serine protease
MRKLVTSMIVAAASLMASTSPLAITNGDLDGQAHPHVGLMVALDQNGERMWTCSGTLVSPTVYVTAAHCTEGVTRVALWFASDVQGGAPANGFPTVGEVFGTPFTHPQYDAATIYADLGVVVLDTGVIKPVYGRLPALGALDALATQRGLQDVTFTTVGYGRQDVKPAVVSERIRMVATPRLRQINSPGSTGGTTFRISANANTGGTCFGDSGGPSFFGSSNVIAGVTSTAQNTNCAGTAGIFRLDTSLAQDWLATFGVVP